MKTHYATSRHESGENSVCCEAESDPWNPLARPRTTRRTRFIFPIPKLIPFWDLRYLFPENIDKIAYKPNMIDTHLSYEAARKHFDITEAAQAADDAEDFSRAIRANIVTRPVV